MAWYGESYLIRGTMVIFRKSLQIFVGSLLVLNIAWSLAVGQDDSAHAATSHPTISAATVSPAYCITPHNIGKLSVGLTNFGRLSFGNEPFYFDCFVGGKIPDCQYPKGTSTVYLYKGGVWVGGIVGVDTLVSTAEEHNNWSREFHPDLSPDGRFVRRSTLDATEPEFEGAISEQDLVCNYYDTLVSGNTYASIDGLDNRAHRPLGIEVHQESYAWSYGYADDFILFNCQLTNISDHPIHQVYFGINMDADVHAFVPDFNTGMPGTSKRPTNGRDDITGFLSTYPAKYYQGCDFVDTIQMAYTADNNGDANWSTETFPVPNVTGVRFLRQPTDDETLSFNWWLPNSNAAYDFGPQHRVNYRNLGSGIGQPIGDRNKYFLMRNGEIDYSQPFMAKIQVNDPDWSYPNPEVAAQLAKGGDGFYLMSLGPYELEPNSSIDIPWAFVGGESLHVDLWNAHLNLTFGYKPDKYMAGLNFEPFATNAVWASRIYDNPGVDSDGDGYAGKFRLCILDSALIEGVWQYTVVDTTYYEGDGVPDWRAATPPPAPKVWLRPSVNGIIVRFNGYQSETSRDFLSGLVDFEGYHVYVGRDDRESSLAMACSYDFENYDIYAYNPAKKPRAGYELVGIPASAKEIRCRFSAADNPCDDTLLNPADHGISNPYQSARYIDSVVYFQPHDNNVYRLGIDTPIRKVYPNEPKPDLLEPITPEMLTAEGNLKYYEYECEIPGLLPTVPYYVNVTAFDFGSPKAGLQPLESSRVLNLQSAYAVGSADQLGDVLPPVFIYPNPYRVDDKYRDGGWEGRGDFDRINDRVRAIHFVNVPAKCTIRIHSLDGDLIRELQHDVDTADPKCHHATWDMISRNVQMIVSGLYYWSVEDESGKVQIGTLVVIM
jgi:hypothetical protein